VTVLTQTMYHVRNRVYDAENGRWTRRDRLGYVDGMGLYEYCRSGPVDEVDFEGLCATCSSSPPSRFTPGTPVAPSSPQYALQICCCNIPALWSLAAHCWVQIQEIPPTKGKPKPPEEIHGHPWLLRPFDKSPNDNTKPDKPKKNNPWGPIRITDTGIFCANGSTRCITIVKGDRGLIDKYWQCMNDWKAKLNKCNIDYEPVPELNPWKNENSNSVAFKLLIKCGLPGLRPGTGALFGAPGWGTDLSDFIMN